MNEQGRIFAFGAWSASGYLPTGVAEWCKGGQYCRWGIPSINSNGELVYFYTQPFPVLPAAIITMTPGGTSISSNTYSIRNWTFGAEPAIARDGTAYFSPSGVLLSLQSGGALRWTNVFAAPERSDDEQVFVPAVDATEDVYAAAKTSIIAYDREGREMRQWELSTPPTAPLNLTYDGRLYVPASGRLYAFRALAGLDASAPWPMYRQNPAGTASRQTVATPLEKPVVQAILPFPDKVRIQCEPPGRPCVLELYRNTTPLFDDAGLIAQSTIGQTFVQDTNAAPGIKYWYWVRFRNSSSASEPSCPVSGVVADLPLNWFVQVPGLTPQPPSIGPEGTLYCSAADRLVSLKRDSTLNWELPGITGSVSVAPDGSVLANLGSALCCLSSTGATNWILQNIVPSSCPPGIGLDGRVFVVHTNGELAAQSISGDSLWHTPLTGTLSSPAAIADDGAVVLLTAGSTLQRCDRDGTNTISVNLPNISLAAVAPVLGLEGTVYVASRNPKALVAVSAEGTEKWRLPLAHVPTSASAIGPDGTIITAYSVAGKSAIQFYLAAVSTNGVILWTFQVGAEPSSSAIGADGSIIFASGTNLIALRASDGQPRWQMDSPNGKAFGTPMLDLDGTLFVPLSGALLSVKLSAGPAQFGWPVFRQNPRQSGCMQKSEAINLAVICTPGGTPELQIWAPTGAVLLRSRDLVHWERFGFQKQTPGAAKLPLQYDDFGNAFYRAVSP